MTLGSEPAHDARSARRRAVRMFALLGAASGALATGIIDLVPPWHYSPFSWLELSPLSLIPGLVFGLLIGLALLLRGLAGPTIYAAYVVASTASYLAAVTLAFHIYEAVEGALVTGMIAGLFGSACLTGLSLAMVPFLRRTRPCLLLLSAGALLGALLALPLEGEESFWTWLFFFAAWQAGYAASLATALPPTARR